MLGSDLRNLPGLEDGKARTYPIEFSHLGVWTDSFDIRLPPGFTVDEAPDPVSVDVSFASYRSSAIARDGLLAANTAEFRKFEGTILGDERAMVVLKKQ